MAPPKKIEVKLAFMPEDTAQAFAVLGLSDPPKEEKLIHFFDSAKLEFFDRDLILRVRQTVVGDDLDDATLKVRGAGAPLAADRFMATAGDDTKFEGDKNVGRDEMPSFSITTNPGSAAITGAVADVGKLESVLNEAGKTLLHEIDGLGLWPTMIKCLGPIRSRIWKFQPNGFAGKISAELWDVAGVQLLEISDKAPRIEASALEEQLTKLVPADKARPLDSSKTRFALKLFVPE